MVVSSLRLWVVLYLCVWLASAPFLFMVWFRWYFLCVWLVFCGFGSEDVAWLFLVGVACCRMFWLLCCVFAIADCYGFGGLTWSAWRDCVGLGVWG